MDGRGLCQITNIDPLFGLPTPVVLGVLAPSLRPLVYQQLPASRRNRVSVHLEYTLPLLIPSSLLPVTTCQPPSHLPPPLARGGQTALTT